MSENLFPSRRSSDTQRRLLRNRFLQEAAHLLTKPKDEREVALQLQLQNLITRRTKNWDMLLDFLAPLYTKDGLLFPDQDAPILHYEDAPFFVERITADSNYYVVPRIINHSNESTYDNYRNFINESAEEDFTENLEFVKRMPQLAVRVEFYAQSNLKYSPEYDEENVYIDREGFIIFNDNRLNMIISKPEPIGALKHLEMHVDSSYEYATAFTNLYMFSQKQNIDAVIQADMIKQLVEGPYALIGYGTVEEPLERYDDISPLFAPDSSVEYTNFPEDIDPKL